MLMVDSVGLRSLGGNVKPRWNRRCAKRDVDASMFSQIPRVPSPLYIGT